MYTLRRSYNTLLSEAWTSGLMLTGYGAIVAKRKTLFDDRPVEIAELTYIIKQDLSSLNSQISALQSLSRSQHPHSRSSDGDQEGEHNKNVSTSLSCGQATS